MVRRSAFGSNGVWISDLKKWIFPALPYKLAVVSRNTGKRRSYSAVIKLPKRRAVYLCKHRLKSEDGAGRWALGAARQGGAPRHSPACLHPGWSVQMYCGSTLFFPRISVCDRYEHFGLPCHSSIQTDNTTKVTRTQIYRFV